MTIKPIEIDPQKALMEWLAACIRVMPTCENPQALEIRFAEQGMRMCDILERRIDVIEERLVAERRYTVTGAMENQNSTGDG